MTKSWNRVSVLALALALAAWSPAGAEKASGSAFGPAPAPTAPGAPDDLYGNWIDHFDRYVTGSQMHGQGGWAGWDDNPAAGALTSDLQARSLPNSVDILGASDLVHQYSGYSSGVWTYTAWQYLPSTLSGETYFIMLNTYAPLGTNNWSVQVNFSATTDLVTNEGATGGALPIVYDQWVEIRVVIDLDSDTQTFYYNGQLLYTGTWTGEVSGGGTLNISAVDLFANGATSAYYDDISLSNLPFVDDFETGDTLEWHSTLP